MSQAVQLFFASHGRLGRLPFLGAVAVLLALFWAYEQTVHGAWRLATGWLVHLILVFCAASVLAKRLHDRNRSGWWAAVILLAFSVVWPQPQGLIDGVFAVVLVWAAIDLGASPGVAGPNRFGPPVG